MKKSRKETSLKALKSKPTGKVPKPEKLLTRRASKALAEGGKSGEVKRDSGAKIKGHKQIAKNFSDIKTKNKSNTEKVQKKIKKPTKAKELPKKQLRTALRLKSEEAAKAKNLPLLKEVPAKPVEDKKHKENKSQKVLENKGKEISQKNSLKEKQAKKDKQTQHNKAEKPKEENIHHLKSKDMISKTNAAKVQDKKAKPVVKEKKLKKVKSPIKHAEKRARKISKTSPKKLPNKLEIQQNKRVKAQKNAPSFSYEALPQIIQQPSIDVKKFENLAESVEKLNDKTAQMSKLFNDLTEKMNGSFQTFSNSTQKALKPITASNSEILKAVELLDKKTDQSEFIKKISNLEKASNETKANLTLQVTKLNQENKKLGDTLNMIAGNLEKLLKASQAQISEEKEQTLKERGEDKQKKIKKQSPVKKYAKGSSPVKNKPVASKEKMNKPQDTLEKKVEIQSSQLPKKDVESQASEKFPKKITEQDKPAEKASLKAKAFTNEPKSSKKEEQEPSRRESKNKNISEKSPLNVKDTEVKPTNVTPVKDFKIHEVKHEEVVPKVQLTKESDSKSKNIVHIDDGKKSEQHKTVDPVREQKDITFGFPFDTKKPPVPPVAKSSIESEKVGKTLAIEKPANQDLIVNFNARVHSPAEIPKQEKSFATNVFSAKPAEKSSEDKKESNIYQSIKPVVNTTAFSTATQIPKAATNNLGDVPAQTEDNAKNSLTASINVSKTHTLHQPPNPAYTAPATADAQEPKQPVKVFFDKSDENAAKKADNFLTSSLDQGAKSAEKKNFFS